MDSNIPIYAHLRIETQSLQNFTLFRAKVSEEIRFQTVCYFI